MSDTLRSAVEAAYASAEAASSPPSESAPPAQTETPSAPAEVEATPTEAPTAEAPRSTRARDASGRFAPKSETQTPEVKPAKPASTPAPKAATPGSTPAPKPAESAQTPPPAPGTQTEAFKAPQSWKPQAREEWAKVPPSVQAEVSRREREVATALQEGAEARKGWDTFRQVVAPFEASIRAEGGEPLAAVRDLLQTAQALRTAPPGHKAQLIANVVRQFGIPIDALDAALAGQSPPEDSQGFDKEALLREAEERAYQRTQQESQARLVQQAGKEIMDFAPQAEFWKDVAETEMPAVFAMAKQAKLKLTLQEAYDRACWMNPDVRAILQRRAEVERANASAASTQQARNAASSVRGSPAAVVPSAGAPKDLRGALEAAFEKHSQ